jgi:hypothetical protein
MEIALGKFFLDALKELRDVFTKAQDRRDNLVATGTFLELYGSATRLQGYALHIRTVRESKGKAGSLGEALRAFFDEVHHFGEVLRKANLSAIDVFHPQLGAELARVVGADASLEGTFAHSIAPRYKLKPGQLKNVVDLYVNHYEVCDGGAWNAEREMSYQLPRWWDPEGQWESDAVWGRFEELSSHLQEFRAVIGDVIKTTWDFKELATLPTVK